MEIYRPANCAKDNEFFTNCNPDMIFEALLEHISFYNERLTNGPAEDLKLKQDTYKVKFNWTTYN